MPKMGKKREVINLLKFKARVYFVKGSLTITVPKRELKETGWLPGTPLKITVRGTTFVKQLKTNNHIVLPKPVMDALNVRERQVIEVIIKARMEG